MKISLLAITAAAVMLSACGEPEKNVSDNHMPVITQKDWEKSEMNKKRDRCTRENRINDTNIDCEKNIPDRRNSFNV
ncbi:conjugal transfer protein TraH [Neisseria musculi]|uniref:Lipoprotein n=1 Tax=Neisseria musculi TaxID=1815583 RepID=A0A7H1M8F9_9NEIS|nr:conjugal transfer protein TraH [Neisseria musculi]QNT57924.1 hypothetical protein H7A79_0246 [Neisseria musculi]